MREARAPVPPALAMALSLVAGVVVYWVIYRLPAAQPLGPLRNLAATLLATLPFGVAVWAAARITRPSHRELWLLFGGAALLRLCIPLEAMVGSDDAYRYLWDGMVQSHGINPYLYPPEATQLVGLRDGRLFPAIFRPDMKTVYPPLAELWFWLAHRLSPGGFAGFKMILLAHDLASVMILIQLLRARGLSPLLAVGYAWSPLAVVQLFGGVHLDGLLVPWCLLSLLLAARHPLGAGAALGAGAMIRPILLLCLPTLLLRRPWRQSLRCGAGFAGATALLLVPYLRAGARMVESLMVYAVHWRFNGSLFRLFDALPLRPRHARLGAYGAIALGSLGAGAAPLQASARYLLALGLYFALAPTVYPWYLVVIIGVGALYPGPLMISLPALITLSDLVFVRSAAGGPWQVPGAALLLEYGLIYSLLLVELYRRWSGSRGQTVPPSEAQ